MLTILIGWDDALFKRVCMHLHLVVGNLVLVCAGRVCVWELGWLVDSIRLKLIRLVVRVLTMLIVWLCRETCRGRVAVIVKRAQYLTKSVGLIWVILRAKIFETMHPIFTQSFRDLFVSLLDAMLVFVEEVFNFDRCACVVHCRFCFSFWLLNKISCIFIAPFT